MPTLLIIAGYLNTGKLYSVSRKIPNILYKYLGIEQNLMNFRNFFPGLAHVQGIFHLSPLAVVKDPKYVEWINSFPATTRNIMLNENSSGYGSCNAVMHNGKLNKIGKKYIYIYFQYRTSSWLIIFNFTKIDK